MKTFEIRDLDPKELAAKVDEKTEETFNLKFQHALHQLDNTAKVRLARRELARMKTILVEHEKGFRKLKEKSLEPDEEMS